MSCIVRIDYELYCEESCSWCGACLQARDRLILVAEFFGSFWFGCGGCVFGSLFWSKILDWVVVRDFNMVEWGDRCSGFGVVINGVEK